MALGDRLKRIEERLGPPLCPERLCARAPVYTRLILHADGTEEQVGDPPPPLCASCPERSDPRSGARHVVIVRNLRGRSESTTGSGDVASGALAASKRHGETIPIAAAGTSSAETPVAGADDGLPIPPAWRDGHPALELPMRQTDRP